MKIKNNMLVLGLVAAGGIGCTLYLSFRKAKWFTLGILLTIIAIVVFMQTENWLTHDATEFENRFWTFVAMIVSFVLFFAVDSPFHFVSNYPSIAWLLVGIVTFMAHNYHRHLTRVVLSRVPNMKRVTSADFSILEQRVKAKQMLAEIRSLLHSIDRPFISSTFLNLFLLAKVLYAERRIIHIFEEADPEQLNFLVLNVQLGLLLYKIKDHRYARQFHRTKLLTLLAVNRVTELSSASRAMLLDGFQRMKLSAHPQAEQWAQSIILKTKADNLSELKSLTDCKGDFNSMHKLIYWDVRNPKVKSEILKHIEGQAKVQASHMILRTKAARMRDKFAWRKILSDVDDTLTCSGGSFPAGCDVSYPKKCIYPGVLAFYRELDLGTTGPDHWETDKRIGNLVFLSARPHLYKDLLESHSYEKFRRLQDTAGMHTSPSLLPGEMISGTEFFVSGSMEPIARKKYENFKEYLSLYPEFECVFIGDNGQGDVRASEMLVTLEDGKFASNLKRTYIHEVLPVHMTYTANSSTRSKSNTSICYFTTYIDAALDAYKHGLIRLHGLRAVVNDAKSDFHSISSEAWASAEGASAIEAELKAKQLLAAVRERNSVSTYFGQEGKRKDGKIQDGKDVDKMLTYDELMSKLPPRKRDRGTFKGFHSPGWKRELRLRELNAAIRKVNQLLATLERASSAISSSANSSSNSNASSAICPGLLTPLSCIPFPCRYPVGSVVLTEYGLGIVQWFRPQDGIYEVIVHWGCDSGVLPDFEECVDRVSRLRDKLRTKESELMQSLSHDSYKESPFRAASSCSFSTPKRKGLTPPCLKGTIVKVMATAASLGPPPPGAPIYMSLTARAKTSTIWKSMTGLLRGGGRSPKPQPRSGRWRFLSGLSELKLDPKAGETSTVLSNGAEMVSAFDKVGAPLNEISVSAESGHPPVSVVTSNAQVSGRPDAGMLSLISTIWHGRGSTAIGHIVTDDSKESDYMQEYYDCLVWTPYGTGHILYMHPADYKSGKAGEHLDAFSEDMAIVELHWGPICSIRRRNTTIISGVVNGVHVGIGGYPLPKIYTSPRPILQIPKNGSDSSLDDERSYSAIASFLRYSPQSLQSKPQSNRVRASTDGTVDVGEVVKLGSHFTSFEESPLVTRSRRSLSVENTIVQPESVDDIPSAISLTSLGRSRANTVDSPMNSCPPAVETSTAVATENRALGYRARLFRDWLFSSKAFVTEAAADSQDEYIHRLSSEEEAKIQQALEDRSGLGIIANNHIGSCAVLNDSNVRTSESSDDGARDELSRSGSFNEGYDPVTF